jgi:hypothetical protein
MGVADVQGGRASRVQVSEGDAPLERVVNDLSPCPHRASLRGAVEDAAATRVIYLGPTLRAGTVPAYRADVSARYIAVR